MYAAGDSKLKNLFLGKCDLSFVDPETLARVVAKLEEVNLTNANLTSLQSKEIFRYADGDSKLKNLVLYGCDLSSVDPETLARVVFPSAISNSEVCHLLCSIRTRTSLTLTIN